MTKAERKKIQQANAAKARAAKAAKKAAAQVVKAPPPPPDPVIKALDTPWNVEVDDYGFTFFVNGCVVCSLPRFPINEKE